MSKEEVSGERIFSFVTGRPVSETRLCAAVRMMLYLLLGRLI